LTEEVEKLKSLEVEKFGEKIPLSSFFKILRYFLNPSTFQLINFSPTYFP